MILFSSYFKVIDFRLFFTEDVTFKDTTNIKRFDTEHLAGASKNWLDECLKSLKKYFRHI